MLECCKHPDWIFVFGSNLAGRHGKGAALHAKKFHAAKEGSGAGIQIIKVFTNPMSYAIPTKDAKLKTLPLGHIRTYVEIFIQTAKRITERDFYVTRIGCGLAGYKDADIAPMFKNAPKNCVLPKGWRKWGIQP